MNCLNVKSTFQFKRPKYEIADIFRDNIDKLGKISKDAWKVVNAIISCRTAKLGGHLLECDHCEHKEISYNSCRNRHCPKCQALKRYRWVEARMVDLLPVEYFHLVFTLPDILNNLIMQNKKVIYSILFKAVKQTLLESTKNPDNLGADVGIIAVLHSWGQNLMLHPHLHCIITGGGLSFDKKSWISSKKGFLIPSRILSKLFCGKFLFYLKKLYRKNKLTFYGETEYLAKSHEWKRFIDILYNKKWIAYAKKPFAKPEIVLKYLGRYTHRIAIANSRIIKVDSEKDIVVFKWKDYKDACKIKLMTLKTKEFMRRFLLHVLPKGFVKIRFYGILSNNQKKEKLKICRTLLSNKMNIEQDTSFKDQNAVIEISHCPVCKKGVLIEKGSLPAIPTDYVMKIDTS